MMMLLVKLQDFEPLVDVTSLFTQFAIAKDADLRFTPTMLLVIASHPSPRFVATLQISRRFFANYSVDHTHSSQVSLEAFHDALLDGGDSSSMTMHLLEKLNKITLRFETPPNVPPLHRELELSPPRGEALRQVEYGKYFTVNSNEFRRIIKELPLFQQDSVSVKVTNTRIRFCVPSKEIVVTKESGLCKIVGFEEVDTLQIILRPMLFFLNLTYKANRIWFYKTISDHSLISIPAFGVYGQYVIHFPQI